MVGSRSRSTPSSRVWMIDRSCSAARRRSSSALDQERELHQPVDGAQLLVRLGSLSARHAAVYLI